MCASHPAAEEALQLLQMSAEFAQLAASVCGHKSCKLLLLPPVPLLRLWPLPRSYIDLYSTHVTRNGCSRCGQRPNRPVLCLLCGELLCAGSCATEARSQQFVRSRIGNCASHVAACGGSAGVFLFLRAGTVMICRNGFMASLPSPYVDCHGEEMRGASHDRPLFLDRMRYECLRRLWGAHEIGKQVTAMRESAHQLTIHNFY